MNKYYIRPESESRKYHNVVFCVGLYVARDRMIFAYTAKKIQSPGLQGKIQSVSRIDLSRIY